MLREIGADARREGQHTDEDGPNAPPVPVEAEAAQRPLDGGVAGTKGARLLKRLAGFGKFAQRRARAAQPMQRVRVLRMVGERSLVLGSGARRVPAVQIETREGHASFVAGWVRDKIAHERFFGHRVHVALVGAAQHGQAGARQHKSARKG